jgi:hypothetical protein
MIGFEAELQVPTFRLGSWPDNADATYRFDVGDTIYSFLFCGYENPKTVVSWSERFLKIKPDVADYAEQGKLLFAALSDFLQIEQSVRFGGEPRMTKLEYETYPIDETAADSERTYLAQAAYIKKHAGKFALEAQNQIVQVPYTLANTRDETSTTEATPESPATGLIGLGTDGMYAGVPVGDIETTITIGTTADASRASHVPAINERLRRIRAKVKPEFAIQATAGIFPSVIPQLFENPQKPLDKPFTPQIREAWEAAYPLICKSVQLLMGDAKFENDDWVRANLSGQPRRDAFKGHLYLLCSYLVGDALSQTEPLQKMSVKNAVPYIAKLNLGYFYKALPEGGSKAPVGLACWIAKALVDQEYVKPEFWSKRGLPPCQDRLSDNQERLIYGDPANFVSNAIIGKPVRTVINQGGQEKIQGEHYDPDSAPLSKHGERGVQLEFRRLGAEGVSLDGLEAAFMNVVKEVRKLNGLYAG